MTDRRLYPLLVFLVAALVIGSVTTPVLAADGIMNLYVGRYIAENGISTTDPFTIEGADRIWISQQWLASRVLYGAFELGGYGALGLLSIIASATAYAMFTWLLVRAGARPVVAGAAGLVVLAATFVNTFVRAQTLALPLFVACGALLMMDGRSRDASPRRWLPLIAMLAIWANVHGSVLIMVVPALGVAAAGLVSSVRRRTYRQAAMYGTWGAAVAAAPLMTPYGLDIIRYYRSIIGNHTISDAISEWNATSFGSPYSMPFIVLLIAAIVVISRTRRERWPTGTTIALVAWFALMGTQAVRYHLWAAFALVALIVLMTATSNAPRSHRVHGPLVVAVTGLAVGVLLIVGSLFTRPTQEWFQLTPLKEVEATADCLRRNADLRVLADGRSAPALLWFHEELAGGQVAFDARLEHFDEARLQKYFDWSLASTPEWQEIAASYDLQFSTRDLHPDTADRLEELERWHVVSSSDRGVLVARDDSGC